MACRETLITLSGVSTVGAALPMTVVSTRWESVPFYARNETSTKKPYTTPLYSGLIWPPSGSSVSNNHPNRNWRQRLNNAADQWAVSIEAELLVDTPIGAYNAENYLAAWRKRLRLAYLAGVRDGEGRQVDLISLDRKK